MHTDSSLDDTVTDGAGGSVSFDLGIIGSDCAAQSLSTTSPLEDLSSNLELNRTDATQPSPTITGTWTSASASSSASASAGATGLSALPFHIPSITDMERAVPSQFPDSTSMRIPHLVDPAPDGGSNLAAADATGIPLPLGATWGWGSNADGLTSATDSESIGNGSSAQSPPTSHLGPDRTDATPSLTAGTTPSASAGAAALLDGARASCTDGLTCTSTNLTIPASAALTVEHSHPPSVRGLILAALRDGPQLVETIIDSTVSMMCVNAEGETTCVNADGNTLDQYGGVRFNVVNALSIERLGPHPLWSSSLSALPREDRTPPWRLSTEENNRRKAERMERQRCETYALTPHGTDSSVAQIDADIFLVSSEGFMSIPGRDDTTELMRRLQCRDFKHYSITGTELMHPLSSRDDTATDGASASISLTAGNPPSASASISLTAGNPPSASAGAAAGLPRGYRLPVGARFLGLHKGLPAFTYASEKEMPAFTDAVSDTLSPTAGSASARMDFPEFCPRRPAKPTSYARRGWRRAVHGTGTLRWIEADGTIDPAPRVLLAPGIIAVGPQNSDRIITLPSKPPCITLERPSWDGTMFHFESRPRHISGCFEGLQLAAVQAEWDAIDKTPERMQMRHVRKLALQQWAYLASNASLGDSARRVQARRNDQGQQRRHREDSEKWRRRHLTPRVDLFQQERYWLKVVDRSMDLLDDPSDLYSLSGHDPRIGANAMKRRHAKETHLDRHAHILMNNNDEWREAAPRGGDNTALWKAAKLIVTRVRRAELDDQHRQRTQQDAQRADQQAQKDRESVIRRYRGVQPQRHSDEEQAAYKERLDAWTAQLTFAAATHDQCTGETTKGERCRLRGSMNYVQAAPLRLGGKLCAHHEPDVALSHVVRCAGTCSDGGACRFTSACSFTAAQPLSEGSAYCSRHLWQGWAPPAECTGVAGACASSLGADTDQSVAGSLDLEHCEACKASWRAVGGWCSSEEQEAWFQARGLIVRVRCSALIDGTSIRCKVTSLQEHTGALPLRQGSDRCAAHGGVVVSEAVPAGFAVGQHRARLIRDERERYIRNRSRSPMLGQIYEE